MSMFDYLDNIFFDKYDQLLQEIDLKRKDLYVAEYNLIRGRAKKVEDIDRLEVGNGRFDIKIEGEELECFLYIKKLENSI